MQGELIVRIFHDHAVARIQQYALHQRERLLSAGNDQNVRGMAQHPAPPRQVVSDGAAQGQIPSRGRIGRPGTQGRGRQLAPPRMEKTGIDERLAVQQVVSRPAAHMGAGERHGRQRAHSRGVARYRDNPGLGRRPRRGTYFCDARA